MSIKYISISGNLEKMGKQYGYEMKGHLKSVLSILLDYYCDQHNIAFEVLLAHAQKLFDRFSAQQIFISSYSKVAGISLDEAKVLNAMEVFMSLINKNFGSCSFIGIPQKLTEDGFVIVGRNYDYPKPFDKCAKYLTVTVMHENGKIPVAIIGLPGQTYCSTGINERGVFCSLNNGMISGGYDVIETNESILCWLLRILQISKNAEQFSEHLRDFTTDFSLIINCADDKDIYSNELSSKLGNKQYRCSDIDVAVITNFFLHNKWVNLPVPSDKKTGYSVTRRENLLKLTRQISKYSTNEMLCILDAQIKSSINPGSTWRNTIYQIAYNSKNRSLRIKIPHHYDQWFDFIDIFKSQKYH